MSVIYPPLREQWFGNVRGDVLSGILVALALIPEAIAFSIIAGVDPRVGLYASFCIAVVTSIAGGRPGMISAATGAMALVMVTLVRDHGLEYLFAASLLTGVFQIGIGLLKLGRYIKFVSRSVMTGFAICWSREPGSRWRRRCRWPARSRCWHTRSWSAGRDHSSPKPRPSSKFWRWWSSSASAPRQPGQCCRAPATCRSLPDRTPPRRWSMSR